MKLENSEYQAVQYTWGVKLFVAILAISLTTSLNITWYVLVS